MASGVGKLTELSDYLSQYSIQFEKRSKNKNLTFTHLSKLAQTLALDPLEAKNNRTVKGCVMRYQESKWWRRGLQRLCDQGLETHLRNSGKVHKLAGKYLSELNVGRFRHSQVETRAYLERTFLQCQNGDEVSLAEVFDHSIANPEVRRAEMMTRLRGMEEYANEHGYESVFITLTLPPKYHAFNHKGKSVKAFESQSPKQGNDHLQKIWTLIRAKYGRSIIKPFGIRVTEPHQDGSPHWHLLLFVKANQKKTIVDIFNTYVEKDLTPNCKLKRRIKVEYIDSDKGSAVGYIAKYVSKNIDGANIETDKDGSPIADSPERIRAWASLWKIRQFQFMGTPPVGVWRELRRINATGGSLGRAQDAADSGDWCAFTEAMQEPQICGDGLGVELMKGHVSTVNKLTGEYTTSETNKYGESNPAKIIGVMAGIFRTPTRLTHWLGKHYEPLKVIGLASVARNPVTSSGSKAAEGSDLGLV